MLFYKLSEMIRTSPARRNKLFLACFFSALGLDILLWIVLLVKFAGAGEFIVLRYNIYFGISSLGPWWLILLMPALGLAVIVANFLLSVTFYFKNSFVSYSLAFVGAFFNLAMFAAGMLLIYFNL